MANGQGPGAKPASVPWPQPSRQPPAPWLHPHRSCAWPPSHPSSASGSRPSPRALLGSQEHSRGAQSPRARRVLWEHPAFLAPGLALRLHPARCHSERLLSPCASPPPPGLFPTRRPHPPQESLMSPPPPHPGSFLLFHARPRGNRGSRGPQTWLYGSPLLHSSWPGRHRQHPHFAAGKT